MTNLPQHRKASSPAPTADEVTKILSSPQLVETLLQCVTIQGTEYRAGTKVTESHRSTLQQAADHIERYSSDRRADRVTAVVAMLLTSFPHKEVAADVASMKMAAYRMACEDVPTWCVEEAAKRWIRGDIGDGTFAPTPPQLNHAARNISLVALGKAVTMRKLASMPVEREITQEQRAATLERLGNVIKWKDTKGRPVNSQDEKPEAAE